MSGIRGLFGWQAVPADARVEAGRTGSENPDDAVAPRATPVGLLQRDRMKRKAMVSALVVAEQVRCVECGICSFNCPLGIDVRTHVRLGLPVSDRRCITCGECVARCPRGTLRFEESSVFSADPALGDA